MTHSVRRALQGAVGLAVITAAIVWLSGGFEERVSPGVAEIAHRAEGENQATAVVEELVAPTVEWASGEIASASHTTVASRVLARIEEVRVRAGSSVSEGDVLVRLDARDLVARVDEAREAQRAAEARLELAETEQARTQELFRKDAAPKSRLDQSTSGLRAARADLAGRKDALRQATTGASFAEIRAPVSGRVVDRLAEPGDTAVPGRPLLRIYDPALLRVEAPVRESLAVQLRVGHPLQVDIPALGEPVPGRIDEIVPFAERGARTLLVKVSLPQSDARLFAGMYARVAIPAGERRFVLAPSAAIERIGQLEYANVVSDGKGVDRRLVTTGERRADDRIEVLSGLRVGERVRVGATASATKSDRSP